jgi:hypothetical protein
MRSIQGLGKALTGWQVLPADAPDFEEAAFLACELVGARDPRIGKVPKSRQKPQPQKAAKKARPLAQSPSICFAPAACCPAFLPSGVYYFN